MTLKKTHIQRQQQLAKKAVNNYIDELMRAERVTNSYPMQKPINLKSDYLINICPTDLDKDIWREAVYYITNSIISKQKKEDFISARNKYVPLGSVLLKDVIGPKYTGVIKKLLELKVIECDNTYKPGFKSLGYRLGKKYKRKSIVIREVTNKKIVNGIRRRNLIHLEEQRKKLLPLAHLVRWLLDDKLTISKTEAKRFLDLSYSMHLTLELKSRNLKPEIEKKVKAIINERYKFALKQLENFENKDIFVDNAGGRLYSNMSNIVSLLRNYLQYEGENLVSIDLKNSQPLHFLIIREEGFWKSDLPEKEITLKNMNKELYDHQKAISKQGSPYTMFTKLRASLLKQGFEEGYKRVVSSGKLYEYISEKLSGKLLEDGIDRFDTRSKSKREFLRLMYFNNNNKYSPAQDSFALFKEIFPFEAELMLKLKTLNYKDFPILLQKVEANVLLHIVCKKIFEHDANIPLFTIHDSILTTEKYADTVTKILEGVYEELLGFIPKIETEQLKPISAIQNVAGYISDKIDLAKLDIAIDHDKESPYPNIEEEIDWIIESIRQETDLNTPVNNNLTESMIAQKRIFPMYDFDFEALTGDLPENI